MIKKLATIATMSMVLLSGCMEPAHRRGPAPVQSAVQAAPEGCLYEDRPVPAECRTWLVLPLCLTEDDAIDGTPGDECWWISNEGLTWYNDGSGVREQ